MGLLYVGRYPDTDFSVLTKAYVDTRYEQVKVDLSYVEDEVAAGAAILSTTTYVDTQDGQRASKAAVDAADANYIPLTQRAAANGVAPLDASAEIPLANLPTIENGRKPVMINMTTAILSGTREMVVTDAKEYRAATLDIPDPGFPYIPMLFAQVQGGSANSSAGSRVLGTGSYGQVTILRDSDDEKYSWCLAASHRTLGYHVAVPFADDDTTPLSRSVMNGDSSFGLYLGLWSGTTYSFTSTGLNFFALIFPGF